MLELLLADQQAIENQLTYNVLGEMQNLALRRLEQWKLHAWDLNGKLKFQSVKPPTWPGLKAALIAVETWKSPRLEDGEDAFPSSSATSQIVNFLEMA